MKSLRILTTVHMANHGACIFIYSLERLLADQLPDYEVRTMDYLPRNRYYHEVARAFKPQKHALTHNLGRFIQAEKFHRQALNLEKPVLFYPVGYEGMTRLLIDKGYDALVTGMVVWDMSHETYLPRFPSIYWLSEKIPAVKIAYAASGHRSKDAQIEKNTAGIQRILSSYALIGVRDQITWEIVQESKVDPSVPVFRVPDPAFMFEIQPTRIREIFVPHGLHLDQPMVGILFYGKPEISSELCRYYRTQGFQTVALSMFNPYADVNLGHEITPFEWADAFKYLSFCVTDRFHGTVFCLKNNIPFISIEPYAPETLRNSKILSLLNDFALPECYKDVYTGDLRMSDFLGQAESLRAAWEKEFAPRVAVKLDDAFACSRDFLQRIQAVVP